MTIILESNYKIQCNTYQKSSNILYITRKTILKFIWIAKLITSKIKKQCKTYNTEPQIILWNHSKKNSIILSQNRHTDQWNRKYQKKQKTNNNNKKKPHVTIAIQFVIMVQKEMVKKQPL
jgi:hypothetical protein